MTSARLHRATVSKVLAIWLAACAGAAAGKAGVDFSHDVAPILEKNCIRCHQPANKKSGFSLATIADLRTNEYVTPGDPDSSYLLDVVSARKGDKPLMPKEGAPLSADDVTTLREWIRQGAH